MYSRWSTCGGAGDGACRCHWSDDKYFPSRRAAWTLHQQMTFTRWYYDLSITTSSHLIVSAHRRRIRDWPPLIFQRRPSLSQNSRVSILLTSSILHILSLEWLYALHMHGFLTHLDRCIHGETAPDIWQQHTLYKFCLFTSCLGTQLLTQPVIVTIRNTLAINTHFGMGGRLA
jgi:hypothetical protein